MERWYNIRGLRNTVTPYQDVDGHWKIPTSFEEVYRFRATTTNQPMYDWFLGTSSSANSAYHLQDSLNVFFNNSIGGNMPIARQACITPISRLAGEQKLFAI